MENPEIPRRYAFISASVGTLLLAQLVRVSIADRDIIKSNPLVIPWIGLSAGLGSALVYFNGRGIGLRGPVVTYLGYGASATLGGFALQHVVNGGLMRSLGSAWNSVPGAMLLGLGSGVCQTLGKVAAVSRFRRYFKEDKRLGMAVGLSVGLGFGLAELAVIAIGLIPYAANVTGLFGVVERCTAIGFHIYSGGLVALAFITKEWWLIAMVVALHTILDGAGVALSPQHVMAAELLFIVITALTWCVWRLRSKKLAESAKPALAEGMASA